MSGRAKGKAGGKAQRPWWEPPAGDAPSTPRTPAPATKPSAKKRVFARPPRPDDDVLPEKLAHVAAPRSTGRKSRLLLLHEDAQLVVVLKPAGLSSVPSEHDHGKSCWSELKVSHPSALAVHRLDRDVSGALLFALDEATRAALEEQFRARTVAKTYLAVVNGTPRPAEGSIRRPIVDLGQRAELRVKGQSAVTHYKVVRLLDKAGRASLVEIELETGRHNQIRLHFVAIGNPLIGERKYARGRDHVLRFGRPALHALKLAFDQPTTGERIVVEAPLPDDFAELIGGTI